VRTLRERVERDAKEALARDLAEQTAHEQALAQADQRLLAAIAAPRRLAPDAAAFVAVQEFLERRERERQTAAQLLAAKEQDVADRRAELAHASREREALARLERRQRQAHAAATARVSEAELGEAALVAHRRLRGGAS
jgi:flagellar export protein FliJ